jgi:hypothetical protein
VIHRRLLVGVIAIATATGTGLALDAASAAPAGGVCTLHGSATFSPNGPGNLDTFGYSFSGDLSNCQSTGGSPASGSIGAGQVLTETVPLTVTNPDNTTSTVSGTAEYKEPQASGTGQVPGASCAAGSTSGSSVVTWANGKTTVIDYSTQSAAAGVELSGSVVSGLTATLVAGSQSVAGSTAPSSFRITTTEASLPVGNDAGGILAFEVSDPTQCTTDGGVTTAGIDGAVAVGNPTG